MRENRRELVLDGALFSDAEGFYREMARLLTRDVGFTPGHNLDALNDLLRGGFGVHDYGEPILIRWLHSEKSRRELGEKMDRIIRVITDTDETGHDCQLILE